MKCNRCGSEKTTTYYCERQMYCIDCLGFVLGGPTITTKDKETHSVVPIGWQCPVCRAVMSPFMAQCIYCKGDNK